MKTRYVLDGEQTLSDWNDFDTQIKELRRTAIADYANFLGGMMNRSESLGEEYYKEKLNEFAENFIVNTRGRKYIKLLNGNSVWGFVVKEDTNKFKQGDILLAASYSAPAMNKPRGNIFEEYTVAWTGPQYL
jgi:hypothetical protein